MSALCMFDAEVQRGCGAASGAGAGAATDACHSSPMYLIKTMLLLSQTALTEQPVFMALLLYRVRVRSARLFFACAIQNFACKVVFLVWVTVLVAFEATVFAQAYYFSVIRGLLFPAQLVACRVQWNIGLAIQRAERPHPRAIV